ncbi:hypothetical protein OV320_6819 [Actinobacteria bacterium OV320]|nr:hypothetical protein OV320_6819 [Actinobacteria bacterium OV320]
MRHYRSHLLLLHALLRTPQLPHRKVLLCALSRLTALLGATPALFRLVNFPVHYYGTNSSCIMASCG